MAEGLRAGHGVRAAPLRAARGRRARRGPRAARRGRERGWVLLPDGGPPLGELVEGEGSRRALRGDDPVRGAAARARAPRRRLLGWASTTCAPRGCPSASARRSRSPRRARPPPRTRSLGRLAALALGRRGVVGPARRAPQPPSLDHNDLHPWNVLRGDAPGRHRFYDWGDSVVTHPFASMLLPLSWSAAPDGGDVERLRDAYLEGWPTRAARRARGDARARLPRREDRAGAHLGPCDAGAGRRGAMAARAAGDAVVAPRRLLPRALLRRSALQSRLNPPSCGCHISSPSCCVNSIFSRARVHAADLGAHRDELLGEPRCGPPRTARAGRRT